MAGYDDLDALVGKLKRSAIDAWMHDGGWRIYSDHYEMNSSSTGYKVTRPGSDGEGSGDWSADFFVELFVDRDAEFRGYFSQVRQTVDQLDRHRPVGAERTTSRPQPAALRTNQRPRLGGR